MQTIWVFIAILIVLVLIGAVAWLVRRFAGKNIGSGGTRGRMPRLAVIDAAAVDGRRRLVLVRRDNVEHLLMIGGPSDLVVESNIVRSATQRDPIPQRQPVGTELPPRPAPLPDATWSESNADRSETFELPEPVIPIPADRPRPSFADETRRPVPPVIAERQPNDAGEIVPEPAARPDPLLPRSERQWPTPSRPELRPEPAAPPRLPRSADLPPRAPVVPAPPRPTVRPSEPAPSAADQNLAEMAQRLEAALRRPARPETSSPAVSISPTERVGAPLPAPEPQIARPETPAEPTFNNLEDEMASLLGRTKNQT